MSNEQNFADTNNNSNSSEILHREPIEGTPFTITGNEDQGYALCFGKYRIGEIKQNKDEVVWNLEDEKWTIIARLAGVIAEIVKNEKP